MKRLVAAAALGLSLLVASGGAGSAQDFQKGVEAYEKGDFAAALREWRFLAGVGDPRAQYNLALMYFRGQGVIQDYKQSANILRLAAVQGDATAQYDLGGMYEKGQGVTQDYAEAVKWYRRAAEQGQVSAQTNLGTVYFQGYGVIQDNVYAHMWWNIAASSGDVMAANKRDIIAKKMTAADISKAQELARACVAKKYKGC
jgi:TPR repeat protein